MSQFADDLIQSMDETVACLDGKGPATVYYHAIPREIRENAGITQQQMASLIGMDLPEYQEWEADMQELDAPTASLFQMLEKEPEAVKRTLPAAG